MIFTRRRLRSNDRKSDTPPSNTSLAEIRRLLGYLKPYIKQLSIALVALTLGTGIGLIFPLLIQRLVNTVLAAGSISQLNQITLILLVTFLIRAIFYYIQSYWLAYIGENIVLDLRSQTYEKLQYLSLRFYSEHRVGELISRLSSDVTVIRTALTNNIATVLAQLLTFVGSLTLMLILNWQLTLFILILAPILIASAGFFGSRLRKLSTKVQDRLAESNAIAEESLSNIRIVKAFNREPYEISRYQTEVQGTYFSSMRATILRSAFGAFVSFLGFASIGLILWFGGREVLAGRLDTGSLIAFLVYGINIAASLGSFTTLYTQLQEAVGASQRIFELIDEKPEITDAADALELLKTQGKITFKDVTFAYPGSKHVLHEIELEISSGEILALVGPSGAGKSTMFNLIPRFYDPTDGVVLIDGHDLRRVSLDSLRKKIGLVPQETQLFSGSIWENLRYGRLDASKDDILNAAIAANVDDFVCSMPGGYDTLVGERGVRLSGGQRQRIAIARAILRDPQILLLDEATSSLDSESENLIQEALDRLLVGRTTIIIAHRLSTIQNADRIAVLDEGRLVELGNHTDLIAAGGLYSRLYQMQFRDIVMAT